MSKIIFGFIGPPGSGKSTQGRLLAEALSCELVNIGAELRKTTNKELIRIMKAGELVPDSYVFEIIEDALERIGDNGFLVTDGFFRRASEVELLAKKQRGLHLQVGALFDLQASEGVVKERLTKRGRLDDDSDGIGARLAVFAREREGILGVAKDESINVIAINGEGTIDEIRDNVLSNLREYLDE
ncbi:MAG: adenylate kinase [Patescibacteria group bacterium]|nr:adenylate kinase [Patescibacteria group bacterium]